MLKYAILLGFVAVCWAQTPQPCGKIFVYFHKTLIGLDKQTFSA